MANGKVTLAWLVDKGCAQCGGDGFYEAYLALGVTNDDGEIDGVRLRVVCECVEALPDGALKEG
jgi:hypothetical protein